MPVSVRKARAKLRSLMQARAARAGTDRSAVRWSGIHAWSSRSGSRSAICAASWALNCAWPPGRLTNRTSQRAISRAISRPRSSSTRASARSMPAVTPAEVITSPSRTKIGSGSTSTSGWRRASSAHHAQWVVARRPSSSPARASRKAPVQTDATRRERAAAARSQPTSRSSSPAAATPVPPGTSSVSIGPRQPAIVPSGCRATLEVGRGRGPARRPPPRSPRLRSGRSPWRAPRPGRARRGSAGRGRRGSRRGAWRDHPLHRAWRQGHRPDDFCQVRRA